MGCLSRQRGDQRQWRIPQGLLVHLLCTGTVLSALYALFICPIDGPILQNLQRFMTLACGRFGVIIRSSLDAQSVSICGGCFIPIPDLQGGDLFLYSTNREAGRFQSKATCYVTSGDRFRTQLCDSYFIILVGSPVIQMLPWLLLPRRHPTSSSLQNAGDPHQLWPPANYSLLSVESRGSSKPCH